LELLLRYYDDKYDSLEALMSYDWRSSWDEYTITGFSAPSRWWNSVAQVAHCSTDIDIRINVEQIMRKLAEKYADSFKHLVALYAMTTQVTRKDAAALAGVTPWNWHKTYEEPMLQEVRYEFAQMFLEHHNYTLPEQPAENRNNGQFTSPYLDWRERYQQGIPRQLRRCWNSIATQSALRERSERSSMAKPTAKQLWTSGAIRTCSRNT
jgi:hypothetical protein